MLVGVVAPAAPLLSPRLAVLDEIWASKNRGQWARCGCLEPAKCRVQGARRSPRGSEVDGDAPSERGMVEARQASGLSVKTSRRDGSRRGVPARRREELGGRMHPSETATRVLQVQTIGLMAAGLLAAAVLPSNSLDYYYRPAVPFQPVRRSSD